MPIRGRRQRALLALLVLEAGQVVGSDRLMEELWGPEPPESGTAALQVRVSQLRKALWRGTGRGLIVTRPPGYLLEVDPEQIDGCQFERLLAEGRALLSLTLQLIVFGPDEIEEINEQEVPLAMVALPTERGTFLIGGLEMKLTWGALWRRWERTIRRVVRDVRRRMAESAGAVREPTLLVHGVS